MNLIPEYPHLRLAIHSEFAICNTSLNIVHDFTTASLGMLDSMPSLQHAAWTTTWFVRSAPLPDAMASQNELNTFLKGVQHRAVRHAFLAVRDEHAAMDIVQESATKLVASYSGKTVHELARLFPRILQNATHDWFRRQRVRAVWTPLFSTLENSDAHPECDFIDYLISLEERDMAFASCTVIQAVQRTQILTAIADEIERLPRRQREAFVLRYCQGMSIAETARAMRCSEGSVKTHCFRAADSLARALRSRGFEP